MTYYVLCISFNDCTRLSCPTVSFLLSLQIILFSLPSSVLSIINSFFKYL